MKIKQTVTRVLLGLGFIGSFAAVAAPALPTYADCGGVPTSIINCSAGDPSKDTSGKVENNPIWQILLIVINILTGGVGIVAVLGLIWGSIQWSTAAGNPAQVQKARTIITNVVIGIIAYIAMFSLLNFLIPGGVFNP